MNQRRIAAAIIVLLIFLAGFLTGSIVTTQPSMTAVQEEPAQATTALSETAQLPTLDVTGADIDGLPRFPGAVRVEYRHVVGEELSETEVEYIVESDLNSVHDFYRIVFDDEGWTVADLGIFQGEWTFFVVSGEREAIVELEVRQSLVEIEIELSEPVAQ